MRKVLTMSLLTSAAIMFFSGCSGNMLGVGYEKSSCEVSGGFGVCGSPKDIYIHKDKIKKLQQDYMKSGYEDELFFGISPAGDLLVKENREDSAWKNYETSDIKSNIESRLSAKNDVVLKTSSPKVDFQSSMSQDVPVTQENDLSVKYQKQKFLLETPAVGGMIRDSGKIQKLWLAPVVDQKDNLVSARTVMVVLTEPKWVVGEKTPKATPNNIIPTPMSEELLKKQQIYNEHNEKVVNYFNNDNVGGLKSEIINNPAQKEKEISEDMLEINKFLNEVKQ